VTGTVGGKAPSGLGREALLDFQMEVMLDGEPLSAAEIQDLLRKSDGLALVRGRRLCVGQRASDMGVWNRESGYWQDSSRRIHAVTPIAYHSVPLGNYYKYRHIRPRCSFLPTSTEIQNR